MINGDDLLGLNYLLVENSKTKLASYSGIVSSHNLVMWFLKSGCQPLTIDDGTQFSMSNPFHQ